MTTSKYVEYPHFRKNLIYNDFKENYVKAHNAHYVSEMLHSLFLDAKNQGKSDYTIKVDKKSGGYIKMKVNMMKVEEIG